MYFTPDEHPVSRRRPDYLECVDRKGQVTQADLSTPLHRIDPPIVPGETPFPDRDKQFVIDLQRRRLESLRQHRDNRRKSTRPVASTSRKKSKIAQALDGLPAELQALALQKLSQKGRR